MRRYSNPLDRGSAHNQQGHHGVSKCVELDSEMYFVNFRFFFLWDRNPGLAGVQNGPIKIEERIKINYVFDMFS